MRPTFSYRLYPAAEYVKRPIEIDALNGKDVSGFCPVCGSECTFTGFNDNLRESGNCSICRSSNRQRQMAVTLRRALGLKDQVDTLSQGRDLIVLNTESTGPVHESLLPRSGYIFSEYWGPNYASGTIVNGVRHEDLQNLSFENETIDIVLSSDVFEHMPEPYCAHKEVFRVLKKGGRHIFTVPFDSQGYFDQVRASVKDGQIIHHLEPLYHGDPINPGQGVLVYRIFGLEMMIRLAEIGFRPTMSMLFEPEHGIIGPGALVFEAIKP